MERDEEIARLFDGADEDRAYDDWRQQQVDEEMREQQAEEALNECLSKGVSAESLKVLARDTGCYRWALQQSLKG
jgi:ferredoxin